MWYVDNNEQRKYNNYQVAKAYWQQKLSDAHEKLKEKANGAQVAIPVEQIVVNNSNTFERHSNAMVDVEHCRTCRQQLKVGQLLIKSTSPELWGESNGNLTTFGTAFGHISTIQ
jgi:hypothetical protein